MSALVSFKDVEQMLRNCAPGHQIKVKTHNRIIYYEKKTYSSMPKYPEVEAGFVKSMVRLFGIADCAKKHLSIPL
jgi:hypothetical protein